MGISCHIRINAPSNGIHKAGSPVTGIVRYFIDAPTEYQDVTLSLLGKGKCRWTDNHGKTSTIYLGNENYISQYLNITDKKPEETVHLQRGDFEYTFEFYLPEDIPTSYKDANSSITYFLQLKFVKASFFSFNSVFSSYIPVYGYVEHPKKPGESVSDGPVIFGLQKALFAPFVAKTPMVKLKAEISKTFLTPGESVHLSYTVSNHTDVAITAVKTELYYYTTYKSDYGSTKKMHGKVKGCEVETPGVPKREVVSFTSVLPTLPKLCSIQHAKVVSKRFAVRVTVRLPLPYINPTVEMPVVLGERKPLELFQECSVDGSQTPNYWEAMSEEKSEEKKEKQ